MMAANLSTGSQQSYSPGEGARIIKGLKPDIVMIQELNVGDGSASSLRQWVNATLGSDFNVFREEVPGKGIPNGIISRYPFISQGVWDDPTMTDREFVWAKIGLPGNQVLWTISVHLSHGNNKKRLQQAQTLVALIKENVPEQDLLVLGGDFNTKNRNDPAVQTLAQVFETRAPFPHDNLGNENTNQKRAEPYDWLLLDKDLQPHQRPVKIGEQTFDPGLVFDSRVYTPLSDVAPVLESDSAAEGMQHMAVVRDFEFAKP